MRFKVPQYIEIEDKIIGPLTLKQFVYLLGGGGILAILWFLLNLALFIIVAIPIVTFFLLLTFYQYKGRPLAHLIGPFVAYMIKPRLYLWKKK